MVFGFESDSPRDAFTSSVVKYHRIKWKRDDQSKWLGEVETPRPFSIFFGGPFSFDVVAVAVVVVVVVEKTSEKKRHGPSSCRRRRRRRAFCVTNERVACVNEAEIPFRSLTKRRRTEERERERERSWRNKTSTRSDFVFLRNAADVLVDLFFFSFSIWKTKPKNPLAAVKKKKKRKTSSVVNSHISDCLRVGQSDAGNL